MASGILDIRLLKARKLRVPLASFSFVLDHDEVALVCDHMVVVEREGGECEGGGGEVVAVVPVEYLAPVSSLSSKINNEHRHTSRKAKF